MCAVPVSTGYYIFNEPLKRAVAEVKAKEARDRAEAGGSSGSTGGAAGGSSSKDVGGGNQASVAAAHVGSSR